MSPQQLKDPKSSQLINVYLPRIILGLYFVVVGAGAALTFYFRSQPGQCYTDSWHSYPPAPVVLLVYAVLLLPLAFCNYKMMSGKISGKATLGMFLLVVLSSIVEFVIILMQGLNNIQCVPF